LKRGGVGRKKGGIVQRKGRGRPTPKKKRNEGCPPQANAGPRRQLKKKGTKKKK